MTLANRITLFRLLSIPVLCVLFMSYEPGAPWIRHLALFVFVLAAVSDVADGFIARAYNQKTALGAVLDPVADKLMTNVSFITLAANSHFEPGIPFWLPVIVLSRDVLIVLGFYLINEHFGPLRVRPRITGKLATFVYSALVFAVLAGWALVRPLLWVAVAFAVVSFAQYAYAGAQQISDEDHV